MSRHSDLVRLRHGYDQVDLSILWDTVTDDLPRLIQELETVLRDEPRS